MSLIKLLVIFFGLVFLLRRNWLLGHCLFLASFTLGLWQGLSPIQIFLIFLKAIKNSQNLLLSCIILSILIFAHSLSKTGQLERVIKAYQGVFPWPRFNLTMLPALIGLLPMPGGAVFSAPFVEGLGKEYDISHARAAIINYWFRHVWEYTWPLYPGLILASHLGEVEIYRLIYIQLPLTIIAFLLGYLFYLPRPLNLHLSKKKGSFSLFLKEMAPILIVVILAISFEAKIRFLPRELLIAVAVWTGILWVWLKQRINTSQLKAIFKDSTLIKVLYAVLSIFCFKEVINGSNIVLELSHLLTEYHIPLFLIASTIPFLIGLIIGLTLAFVGTTFPLITALIQATHAPVLPYIFLAFGCGVVGVLLSPMHLCFILSLEYFHVPFDKTYHKLYLPCVIMAVFIGIWFLYLIL